MFLNTNDGLQSSVVAACVSTRVHGLSYFMLQQSTVIVFSFILGINKNLSNDLTTQKPCTYITSNPSARRHWSLLVDADDSTHAFYARIGRNKVMVRKLVFINDSCGKFD